MSVLFLTTTAADSWDKQKALRYLETRQQAWADWKPAQRNGGPCFLSHRVFVQDGAPIAR
jgi:hypothetical protein